MQNGHLEYKPYPICNENGKPLQFSYAIDSNLECSFRVQN